MPISLTCNNSYTDRGKIKKCGTMEPFMDPKTEKVYCSSCLTELTVNHFTKITMKNLKQFKEKNTQTFNVKCQKCKTEAQPVMLKNDFICPQCNNPHQQLSEPFKIVLREKLKTTNQDL